MEFCISIVHMLPCGVADGSVITMLVCSVIVVPVGVGPVGVGVVPVGVVPVGVGVVPVGVVPIGVVPIGVRGVPGGVGVVPVGVVPVGVRVVPVGVVPVVVVPVGVGVLVPGCWSLWGSLINDCGGRRDGGRLSRFPWWCCATIERVGWSFEDWLKTRH